MSTIPQLRAQTTALPTVPVLAHLLTASRDQLAWMKDGEGFVAAGTAARFEQGPTPVSAAARSQRFALASQWWTNLAEETELRDDVNLPGSGLVCLGSFSFEPDSPAGSTLIVPQVLVGVKDGRGFLTLIGPTDNDVFDTLEPEAQDLLNAVLKGEELDYNDLGAATIEPVDSSYESAFSAIQDKISTGDVSKVVLARAIDISTSDHIDERTIISRLADAYPNCWTFAVDGLIGATPELLARTEGNTVTTTVLAGTLPRTGDEDVADLLASDKDRHEHELAVASVVDSLSRLGDTTADDEPFALELPNVIHLATNVSTRLSFDANALQVTGALHPTAALGGTPTHAALDLIAEVEGIDRDRYGAPVGWLDTQGNGEWCVALRCLRVEDGTKARAWAGGGIVADSDMADEYAETEAKLAPVLHAFGL